MNRSQARALVSDTFTHGFDKARFRMFVQNLVNHFDESKAAQWNQQYVKDAFKDHVQKFERLGTYTSPNRETLDVLIVYLTTDSKLERARTSIRNFVADHLKQRNEKDAALVAFVSPSESSWRFSYIRMEYATVQKESGKVGVEARLTPARRFSYIVGEGESCHTAQSRFLDLLANDDTDPNLAQIEEAFSVEAVTKEFFEKYAELFGDIHAALEKLAAKNKAIRDEFARKDIQTVDFAKKLMGQIVFLYFLQKKGWLGVERGKPWGTGPHDLLRRMASGEYGQYKNFFNDILEPLFYDTLAKDRGHEAWCDRFKCRIPFLNGGLFEPLGDYDWRTIDIPLPNELFTNNKHIEEGVTGSGVLDVFDRYNFTVNEAEPLEQDVAVDPEMLGKVFENLIEENRRKGLGSYYTPREVVHFMCADSLISYLDNELNRTGEVIPRADLETLVRLGEQYSFYEAAKRAGTIGKSYPSPPKTIQQHARLIDERLSEITVCDPAVGSGAFPVGMMTEVVRIRCALTPYFNDVHERTPYQFKRHAIHNCLYGVDIDPGAVEIAKLRLWLSLVVDEEEAKQIKPLPNLDFKIVVGNSLTGFPYLGKGLQEAERLKARFFEESDHDRKADLKREIDRELAQCFESSKSSFGYEIAFDFNVMFSEVFHRKGGFDVMIANPPYGADIDKLLPVLRPLYHAATKNYAEIYKMFLQLGLRKIREGGTQVFITPNTFLAQPRYKDIRTVLLEYQIVKLVNLGEEVFENVIVPTCVSFIRRAPVREAYEFADLSKESKFTGDLNSIAFSRVALERVYSSNDLSLYFGRELRKDEVLFGDALEVKDAGIQYHRSGIGLKNKGGSDLYERLFSCGPRAFEPTIPVWYGKLIDRWVIQPETDEFFNLNYRRVLNANESVSFTESAFNTSPKILWRQTASCLRAVIDTEKRWFRNTIQCAYIKEAYRTRLDIFYVLGVVNSRYTEHAYNVLVKEAGRVFPQVKLTHVKKLPLAIPDEPKQKEIADLVKKVLNAKRRNNVADTSDLEQNIDQLVYAVFGLTRAEIEIVEKNTSRRSPGPAVAAEAHA
ncbi:MAG: Eco57I restriction-modification methylase domain-containing protein [Acidobacteriota bacterium]